MPSNNCKEVAVSAAFMGMGYATACVKQLARTGSAYLTQGWGQLETVAFLTEAAERLEAVYCALPDDIRDSAPGVWAYEVAEPIGVWFGERTLEGGIPSEQEMDSAMIELVADFFTQCDEEERQAETKPALVATLTALMSALKSGC